MNIDTEKLLELIRRVRPLFTDAQSLRIRVKGVADFVTQVDVQVQEIMQKGLRELNPEIQFMGEEKENREIVASNGLIGEELIRILSE